jgi:peroxiredoxin
LTPVPLPPLEEQRAGLVGTPAPALAGTAVRGRAPRTLEGDAPTLLFFWAPGCAACDRALPETLAHAADLGARVLAVTEASPAAVDAFLRRDDGPFPEIVLSDPERRTHAAYGVDGVPAIVSVDRGGLLRGFQLGHSVAHGVRLGDGTTGPRPGAAPPRR